MLRTKRTIVSKSRCWHA